MGGRAPRAGCFGGGWTRRGGCWRGWRGLSEHFLLFSCSLFRFGWWWWWCGPSARRRFVGLFLRWLRWFGGLKRGEYTHRMLFFSVVLLLTRRCKGGYDDDTGWSKERGGYLVG